MADMLIQLAPALVWTVLMAVPLYFILPRAGRSRWWLVVAVVPMIGALFLLWFVAFSRWSSEKTSAS